jgi:6-phosphogluconolactonase/glucosamine-6-phosphate isomerase/deaminase
LGPEALLVQIPIPEKNIHPIPTEGLSLDAAASAYESELKIFYGADRLDLERPIFDVTLLRLGLDGHTNDEATEIMTVLQTVSREERRWIGVYRGGLEGILRDGFMSILMMGNS